MEELNQGLRLRRLAACSRTGAEGGEERRTGRLVFLRTPRPIARGLIAAITPRSRRLDNNLDVPRVPPAATFLVLPSPPRDPKFSLSPGPNLSSLPSCRLARQIDTQTDRYTERQTDINRNKKVIHKHKNTDKQTCS